MHQSGVNWKSKQSLLDNDELLCWQLQAMLLGNVLNIFLIFNFYFLFNTKTVTDTKVEKNHTNMCPEQEKCNTMQQ